MLGGSLQCVAIGLPGEIVTTHSFGNLLGQGQLAKPLQFTDLTVKILSESVDPKASSEAKRKLRRTNAN
jgi:hypothetical protein